MSTTPPLIGVPALAEALGVSRWTVYRLRLAEDWPTSPVGGSLRFSEEDVEKIKARRRPKSASAEPLEGQVRELTAKQKATALKRLGLYDAA